MPEKMPDGITVPEGVVAEAVKYAMERGHSPQVVSDMIGFQVSTAAAELAQLDTEGFQLGEAAKAEIRSQVGPENYENVIADAKSVNEILGLSVDEATLVGNPNLVVTLSRLKDTLSEGTLKSAGLVDGNHSGGAASKISQAEDIVANENNPLHTAFHDPTHVQHDTAMATHSRLISESVA